MFKYKQKQFSNYIREDTVGLISYNNLRLNLGTSLVLVLLDIICLGLDLGLGLEG